jgi:hypothetical protein
MKRRRRKAAAPSSRITKRCVDLTQDGTDTLSVIVKQAMYSQGYPGHPPETIIEVPGFAIYGQDAVQLSEIGGVPFVPPTQPAVRRVRRRSKKK